MKLEKAFRILGGLDKGDLDGAAHRLRSLTFQDAIEILAHYQLTGPRDAAAQCIAQDLTTQDKDGLVQWAYNRDYTGQETIESLQAELVEIEAQ